MNWENLQDIFNSLFRRNRKIPEVQEKSFFPRFRNVGKTIGCLILVSTFATGVGAYYLYIQRRQHRNTLFKMASPICGHPLESEIMASVAEIRKLFHVDNTHLNRIINSLKANILNGLEIDSGTLKMLPSFVTRVPLQEECQDVIALDLGGTNLRVMKIRIETAGKLTNLVTNKYIIPEKLMVGEGEDLFDFIATCVRESLEHESFGGLNVGFTFSFPLYQVAINSAILLEWTKGFAAHGTVGKDIGELLNHSFRKQNTPLCVTALVNDTVGTLMSGAFEAQDQNCVIGLILGTGSNACYLEKLSRIKKWEGERNFENMIVNIEWGAFDSPVYRDLPVTKYDLILDQESLNIGKQHFEKMLSGMYLGEIARLVIKDWEKNFDIFQGIKSPHFDTPYQFDTQYMSQIEQDTSEGLHGVGAVLKALGIITSSYATRYMIKELCNCIAKRSAILASAGICSIIDHLGRKEIYSLVTIDGSVFEHYPGYRQIMEKNMKQLGFNEVQLRLAKDGSGNGAALTAAVVRSCQNDSTIPSLNSSVVLNSIKINEKSVELSHSMPYNNELSALSSLSLKSIASSCS